MAINYVEGDQIRVTKADWNLVDIEYYNGEKFYGLEPRRLFPLSGLTKYITLLDVENKEEHAVIRDLATLMPESRAVIEECLNEYYLIPRIIRLLEREEKYGILKWTVETDRGVRSFDIRNRHSDMKTYPGDRVIIRDSNDNRYEIENLNNLDRKSWLLVASFL